MISFSFDVLMQTDVFCDCVQMNSAFHRQLLAGVQWRFPEEIDFSADFRLSSSFFIQEANRTWHFQSKVYFTKDSELANRDKEMDMIISSSSPWAGYNSKTFYWTRLQFRECAFFVYMHPAVFSCCQGLDTCMKEDSDPTSATNITTEHTKLKYETSTRKKETFETMN